MMYCNYCTVFEVVLPWMGASNPWAWLNIAAFESILLLVHWSHWMAALTRPGHVEQAKHSKALQVPEVPDVGLRLPDRTYCNKCKTLRPQRAHHCSICGVCVMKMDHHCPWINNCLGMNNHKFFIQFLMYVCIGSIYSAALAAGNVWWCLDGGRHLCVKPPPHRLVMGIISAVLSVFFAIFVIAMMCDQWEALVTDTTGIEAMKKWDLASRTIDGALEDICGEPLCVRWILPTPMPKKTAFDHSTWTLAQYDDWDERDPTVRDHFDRARGYDWIDDATRLRYGVDTVLDQLNASLPRGLQSHYVVGPDGYPQLRVFRGEEKHFEDLGVATSPPAARSAPKKSPTTTPAEARDAASRANDVADAPSSLDEVEPVGCARPRPDKEEDVGDKLAAADVRQRVKPAPSDPEVDLLD